MKKNILLGFVFLFSLNLYAQEQRLIILHTNDHHGHYNSFDKGVGGLSAQKTYIDSVRAKAHHEGKHVLVLSGGDINTGTFESDLQKAEPDFKAMHLIGYDAMAVGNHEWDNPLNVILQQQAWANFPFLSANTRFKDSNKPVFKPYTVFCFPKHRPNCELKVGVVGLTTPETKYLVSPDVIENIQFTDPVKEAKKSIQKLKKQKVDLIVAVTHMGHDGPEKDPKGNLLYRDVMIAKKLKNLDVIVGGHTQVPLPKPLEENNTLILQAHEWGKYVGNLELSFDKKRKLLKNQYAYELVPINLEEKGIIEEDPSMLTFFKPFNDKAQALGDQVIGELDQEIIGERKLVRSQAMPIGAWMAFVFKDRAKADFAMMNAGGIRASLLKGAITKKDVHTVHPFGNTLVFMDMTPLQVFEYLNAGYNNIVAAAKEAQKKVPDLQGYYPQYYGVSLHVQDNKIVKIKSTQSNPAWEIVMDNGLVKSSTKQKYTFATINFIAKGGDGYPILTNEPSFVDSGLTVDHLLIEYFSKSKVTSLQQFEDYIQNHPIIRK